MVQAQLRQTDRGQSSRLKVVLAFAAVYIIWGSTYLAIRFAIETLPPFLMAGARFLTAGLILFTWSILKGNPIPPLSQWGRALIVGMLLLLFGNGGVTWAEKYIASGFTALLIATEPLSVVLLNWVIARRRPNYKVMLGVVIGLGGVALLIGRGLSDAGVGSTMELIAAGVIILSSLAWASGSVYTNRSPPKASTSMASAMQMLMGGSLLLLAGLLHGDFRKLDLHNTSWASLSAFMYLTVFGSLVAFTAYSWLLKNVAPAAAATYAYVNPVVAVVLGWLIASEPLTASMIVAAAIIVASVVLITTCSADDRTPVANQVLENDTDCPVHPCR